MVKPPAAAAPDQPRSAAAPPAPPAAAQPKAAEAPRAPSPTAAPTKPKKDFDTVHVFYGTDRTIKDTAKRVGYSGNRGRKLLLGKAVVTVPLQHQVPNVERPWKIKIPYFNITVYEQAEDPKKHFTIQDIKRLGKEDFIKLVRQRLGTSDRNKGQALVFIHGYNNTFDNALYRTAQVAYDLRFDGVPFMYSWPSGGGLSSYTYDRDSSRQAEPYLREFLQIVINETGAKSINIIAHSMGNLPLLHVLREIKLLAANKPDVRINQIILAAPDVDRDIFINLARTITGVGAGMTLYASSSDKAMLASRTFGGGIPRAGDVPANGPVVVAGIDTIDVTAVSTELLAINHSGYARSKALLNDIELLIRTGERPPEKRIPILERVEKDGQVYWRYPG
jgi:esterase/lipase superfamily enzyme